MLCILSVHDQFAQPCLHHYMSDKAAAADGGKCLLWQRGPAVVAGLTLHVSTCTSILELSSTLYNTALRETQCACDWLDTGCGERTGGSNAAVPHTGLPLAGQCHRGGPHADHHCSAGQTGNGEPSLLHSFAANMVYSCCKSASFFPLRCFLLQSVSCKALQGWGTMLML